MEPRRPQATLGHPSIGACSSQLDDFERNLHVARALLMEINSGR
jgi:hypothetical protein